MAFNFGSFGGGVISGAGAGSVFGPIGAGVGAALGGISSLFGGGASGGTQFAPSELMQRYMDIGLAEVKPERWQKKAWAQEFKNLRKAGDRGAAEDMYRGLSELYPTSKGFSKKLTKSLKKDVDFYNQQGWNTADQIYKNAGVSFTPEEFQGMTERAKGMGIRGSAAFGDFLKQNLIAQGKMMTPQQEMLSYIFGTPTRTAEGKWTTEYPTTWKMPEVGGTKPLTYVY